MQTKKQKRIAFNQACILDAAKELFSQNGVTKTNVDQIACVADCSKATIYVYFKSKDDIYYHIVLEYMTALYDSVKKLFSNTNDYENAYFALCRILVQFQADYPIYFDCILGNISVNPTQMKEWPVLQSIFEIGEKINIIVCDFFERAKTSGFVRMDIDPLQSTFMMWSGICGWISLCANKQQYLTYHCGVNIDDYLQQGFGMILRMVKKGKAE